MPEAGAELLSLDQSVELNLDQAAEQTSPP